MLFEPSRLIDTTRRKEWEQSMLRKPIPIKETSRNGKKSKIADKIEALEFTEVSNIE